MKPKLMTNDGDKMQDHVMFFYPDDNPEKLMQGCLTKNTLALNNASVFITLNIVKEEKRYLYQILNKKGKVIYFEYSKRSCEERLGILPVAEHLTKEITNVRN